MATAFRTISNSDGSIELTDSYNRTTEQYYKEPILIFSEAKEESCWDNYCYVFKILRGLKENEKRYKKEVKKFCEVNKFDYKEVKKDLIDIFIISEELNFWKDEDTCLKEY